MTIGKQWEIQVEFFFFFNRKRPGITFFFVNSGWGFDDILPYFMKSEDNLQINEVDPQYHRTGGLLPVSKFPYHPPLSYAILRAATELGEFN